MLFFAILGGFVGVVGLIVVSSLLRGYVLSILWGWFMVPIFHLPVLSVMQAIGIALTISYLIQQTNFFNQLKQEQEQDKKKKLRESMKIVTFTTIIYPLIALLIGYIVHKFM